MRELPHAARLGHRPNCTAGSGPDGSGLPLDRSLAGRRGRDRREYNATGRRRCSRLETAHGGLLRLLEDVANEIAVRLGFAAAHTSFFVLLAVLYALLRNDWINTKIGKRTVRMSGRY
jgi:hypothetical protein